MLAITSGWGASYNIKIDPRNSSWSPIYGLNIVENRDRYTLTQKGKNQGSIEVSKVNFSGTVFCLTTKSENFLVKHNGYVFFSGNSAGCLVLQTLEEVQHLVTILRKYDPKILNVNWGL